MAAESLRQELLSLPGVAEAEVDESGDSPSGVRVKLSPDADARRVGVEVQRILAAHGLRSRVSGDEAPEPAPSPLMAVPPIAEETPASFFDEAPPPPATPPPMPAPEPPSMPPPTPRDEVSAASPGTGLAAVRIEESRDGVTVTAVASDGRTLTERAPATAEGMIDAVIAAVGSLADGRAPTVLGVARTQANGSEVITVVVERPDGSRGAGAAVIRASRAFAVGRATWSALRSD